MLHVFEFAWQHVNHNQPICYFRYASDVSLLEVWSKGEFAYGNHQETARHNQCKYSPEMGRDMRDVVTMLKQIVLNICPEGKPRYCRSRTGQGLALMMKLQFVGRDFEKVKHPCLLVDYNYIKNTVANSSAPAFKTHALTNRVIYDDDGATHY